MVEVVKLGWQKCNINQNRRESKTLTAFQKMTSELNSTLVGNMETAFASFFVPQSCRKNTPVLVNPTSTPYALIYRSEFLGVDTPLLCDTVTDGGGWIVIQRRSTGDVDFFRDWASYKQGFGVLNTGFWLGNENIHTITSTGKYELRVELKYRGQSKYALYGSFSLAGEDAKYTLTVGSYSGTAGDSLHRHNGLSFSTYDRDNDSESGNCAKHYTGAWWFDSCHKSNLNGKWGASDWYGLNWKTLAGNNTVTFSEMKIRRVDN